MNTTTPTWTYEFVDGSTRELNIDPAAAGANDGRPVVIGLDPEGRVVVRYGYGEGRQSWTFGLTLCCNASDKGVESGVVCRGCYGDSDVGSYDPVVAVPVRVLPELVESPYRNYRLFTRDHGSYYDFYNTRASRVTNGYLVSYSTLDRTFSSPEVVAADDRKVTLNISRILGPAEFEKHELDGTRWDTADDAYRAAFDAGALAFMWYEDDRTAQVAR